MDRSAGGENKKKFHRLKTIFFILEVSFVLALLILWLSFEALRKSKSLWVLFFYSFPSEFLIAAVPHEPVLLYFGKFVKPLTVALVSVSGTVLTEALNYSVFGYFVEASFFHKTQHGKAMAKVIGLFNKAPFAALFIAGFTPIPFYPFRFLVVLARYPLAKYCLAVFVSRGPRFFILALIGRAIQFPDYFLIIFFVALIISTNWPILRKMLKNRGKNRQSVS